MCKRMVTGTLLAGAMALPVQAQELFEMTSGYSANLPILGTASVAFVEKVNGISESVEFEHFNPGELVPALEMLDAVSNGSVDAAYSTSGYWQGKMPGRRTVCRRAVRTRAGRDAGVDAVRRRHDAVPAAV